MREKGVIYPLENLMARDPFLRKINNRILAFNSLEFMNLPEANL